MARSRARKKPEETSAPEATPKCFELERVATQPVRRRIFVDSGAFSAWRLGKPVSLDAYCDFLETAQEWAHCYACLDEIIPDDPEEAARRSFDNLVTMRARGFPAIPVFHVREDISWLHRMLDLGCDYIGLSATSIVSRSATDDWYDLAWSHLVDASGAPLVRVHAFGEAREDVLTRFPWASSDSSSWLTAQTYGYLFLEGGQRLGQGSSKERNTSRRSGADIELLEGEDATVLASMVERAGVDLSALDDRGKRVAWLARSYLTVRAFLALEARVRARLPIRFVPGMAGGLVHPPVTRDTRPREFADAFDLYLATGSNVATLPLLYIAGVTNWLSSYFYINDLNHRRLRAAVTDAESVITQPPFAQYTDELRSIIQ